MRTGRRAVLNEALHELRRPLQALALAGTEGRAVEPARLERSVRLAASALARLDREINGGTATALRVPVAVRPLVEASLARWRTAAAFAGTTLELRWRAGEAVVGAESCELAQLVDNLLVNAIEHGGPRVAVEALRLGDSLRLAVVDGGAPSGRPRRLLPAALALRGRRRGHGLRVVRRIAAEHGGGFSLRRSPGRTEAVVELPLLDAGTGS